MLLIFVSISSSHSEPVRTMRPFYAFEFITDPAIFSSLALYHSLRANPPLRKDILVLAEDIVGFNWESVYVFHEAFLLPLRLVPPFTDARLCALLDEAISQAWTISPNSSIILPEGCISVSPSP